MYMCPYAQQKAVEYLHVHVLLLQPIQSYLTLACGHATHTKGQIKVSLFTITLEGEVYPIPGY